MFPSISGAFRSLHCLIYKVHVPRGTFTILALTRSFVKPFFQVFSNSFIQNRHPLEPDSSSILPDTRALVKYYFLAFSPSFAARPPRAGQLDYYTTHAPLCQHLFRLFFPFFPSLVICPKPPLFSLYYRAFYPIAAFSGSKRGSPPRESLFSLL